MKKLGFFFRTCHKLKLPQKSSAPLPNLKFIDVPLFLEDKTQSTLEFNNQEIVSISSQLSLLPSQSKELNDRVQSDNCLKTSKKKAILNKEIRA